MSMKRAIPENPYLPSKGMNPDTNGLALRPEECIDLLNLRVSSKEITTRGGSTQIAANVPGGDPILHMHTWKAPTGLETLFGFSKNATYRYDMTSNQWVYTNPNQVFSTCESGEALKWTYKAGEGELIIEDSTIHQVGSGSTKLNVYFSNDKPVVSRTDTFIYDRGAAAILDLSTYTTFTASIYCPTVDIAQLPTDGYTTISFGLYNSSNVLIETTTPVDIIYKGSGTDFRSDFQIVAYTFTTLASLRTAVRYVRCYVDYYQSVPATYTYYFPVYIDQLIATVPTTYDVEMWKTTDFIDNTIGSTVIAAGSNPPQVNEIEDDAGSRTLMYYNPTSGQFTPLSLQVEIPVVDENTGKLGLAGTVFSDTPLVAMNGTTDRIVWGTFYVYSAEHGTLATMTSVVGGISAPLIPTDSTKVSGGYVKRNGIKGSTHVWSITILDNTYINDTLYVAYVYTTTSTYKPRFVWNFNNRLLMGGMYEGTTYYPWRLRWTEIANLGLTQYGNYLDLVSGDVTPIMDGDYQGYYLIIYKQNSIIKVRQNDTTVFMAETVWKDGTYTHRTLKTYQYKQYYLGVDDVYCWDGSSRKSLTYDVGSGNYRIREKIFNLLDQGKMNTCFGGLYPRFQEYWLWITKVGESAPSSVFVYNIAKDVWYFFEYGPTTCMGNFHNVKITSQTFDELLWNMNAQDWTGEGTYVVGTLDATVLALQAGNVYLIDDSVGTDGGYVDLLGVEVDGTAISSRLITRDFVFSDLPRMDRCQRVNFESKGSSVVIRASNTFETVPGLFRQPTTIPLDYFWSEKKYHPDITGDHVRFCIEATDYFSLRWLQPYAVAQELYNS